MIKEYFVCIKYRNCENDEMKLLSISFTYYRTELDPKNAYCITNDRKSLKL